MASMDAALGTGQVGERNLILAFSIAEKIKINKISYKNVQPTWDKRATCPLSAAPTTLP